MEDPKPCPICGAKAYIMHDVVAGFEFGWSAGCPRFRLYDGIHGMDEDTPQSELPRVMYCTSKQDAIEKWNRRVSDGANAGGNYLEKDGRNKDWSDILHGRC